METITFTIDARRGSIRADRPLYLAAAYNVLFAGDYAGGTPLLILSNHRGDPVAETRTEDDATTLELDTAELAKEFRDSGIVACPGSVTLHLWALDSNNNTIAQSDIPVFYSPYYTAPSGTLTKIDTQGPPGPRGFPGLNGAGLPTFHIDDDGNLMATSPDPNVLYWTDGAGVPVQTKPRWWLSDGTDGTTAGHLYYIVYDEDGAILARHDLGLVKGAKGDKGDTPEMPGIEPQPTPGSTNLVTSGGVAAAIEGVANDAANLYVAKSKITQALAGVGNPADLATIGQVKNFLSAMKNAISYLATAIAAALFIAQPAHGTTLENLDLTNEVYTATETATLVAAATNSINAATVPLSDADAARGVTFDDPDGGIDQNVAMRIGLGARAGLPDDAASAAADNTALRSAGVAIGPNADATATNADGTKNQGVAVGWNSKAGYNAVAIGGGAQHGGETDMTGNATYAPGETAVAIGYSAKATNAASVAVGRAAASFAEGAVQIGAGTNSAPNTLKFRDTVIVANGKVAAGTDTNTVARMIRDESEKGVMYGSTHKTNVVDEATGATNTWSYIKLEGVNDTQGTDPMFIMAVNEDTNSPYACSFPVYPNSPNRRDIYSAQTVDRIVDGATNDLAAAVGAMMARIAAWGSPYESPLLSSLGPAGSEGPTVYTRGGENELSVSFWMRYQPHAASTNQAAGLVPGFWPAFCIPQLSMAPARATREGGAALAAFLDLPDVPLGASGHFATNCLPSGLPTQDVSLPGWPSARPCYVVCANVNTDVPATLTMGGVAVTFPASNGVVQVRNVAVPADGGDEVAVDAEPGGAVSLALAVNPWVEFKCLVGNVPEYRYGDGGRGMDGPVQVTNSFVHVVGRLRLSPGGGLDALYTLRNLAGGAMSATGAVSTAFSSGSFPADVRLRHVWGALAGGFGGGVSGDPEAVVQRFAPRSAPVWWTDAEVDDLYLRGLRELRARGLDRPLPDRGAQ